MTHPPIVIVDKKDNPIGQSDMFEARRKGLIHRIVRVMIEDKDGRILLQRRSNEVYSFPNCWDHSAAGHVDVGEDYMEAAKRELAEEIGINDAELEEIGRYYTENEKGGEKIKRFNGVYRGIVDTTPTHVDPKEVGEIKWFTTEEIRKLIKDQPDKVTDGLIDVLQKYYRT